MDAEVDSDWICTQAVVNTDNQSDDEREKINNYGCIVLNDMIDNGRYILKEGDNTIGRHPLNHIYIEHPSISMNHAVIQCDSDGVVLLDKGSLNKTKLNKKILKKNVAYFLEENALLMFGEVRADYFVNERSNEFTNDTKSMVPENTNIHKETQNNGNLSKSSNAAINPKSFRTDIPSSTCKLDKEIPKNVTGTECAINNINDIHTKLNSSSPSDEYLLEALSQIEAKQNNVNSNEIVHNLSNKDIPIMNQTQSMPEIIRVDTPSPVMNLENSILTSNDAMKNQFQSPNKINTEVLREDTPSPVMDLGCYNDIVNNLKTDNYGNISAIQSPNKVDEFDSTQVLEIDNNIEELHTRASNNDNIFLSEPQKVDSCNQSNTPIKNYSNVQSNENLSGLKYINLNAKCSVKSTDHFCSQNDFNNDKHKNIINTFEADDDDVFRHFIENECKSQQHNLEMLENQDFFNCSTQKISINKNIISKPKVSPTIHEEETQIPSELTDLNKTTTITSKIYSNNIHEDLTEVPVMDDDFFNCSTQKLSITKKLNPQPKLSSSLHDEDTQNISEFLKPSKSNSILSKSNSTSIHEENTQIPKIDDDFFNYPTQKVSINKNIISKPKVSPLINKEETQIPSELTQFNKTTTITSKIHSTNIHKDLTEVPNMDDDFFNCPTQKLSITKNINLKPKAFSSKCDEETLKLSDHSKPKYIASTSKSIHESLTEVPKMNEDFFNCPTQKLSITKTINPKLEVSSTVHVEETHELLEFPKPIKNVSSLSKSYIISKHDDSNQIPTIDDDFFNCPTQKIPVTKKVNQPNIFATIHEENTQKPAEVTQLNKTNINISKTDSTNKHIDVFSYPNQKVIYNSNSNISIDCRKHESVPTIINEGETQDSMMQSVSKISLPSNMKHDKRNIVNSTTQIVLTKVHSNSISNCSINMNEGVAMNPKHFDGSNNHKQTTEPRNEDGCKVQKSKCVKSNTISISNAQISDICNEKSPNNLRIKKPQIRVRKDLHIVSCSGDSSNNSSIILNKSNKNSVFNNINTTVPLNKNFDSPGCSKSITKKNDLNVSSSTKQKHFTDDSLQSQVSTSLKYNHQMKKLNESIFSPLNIPDVSANSLLEHPSSPKITENNLNTLNCEPSTSSNNAFEWKSFWHKKKVQSQDKGKNDKQKSIKITPEIKENKERYQTRALTRKRKQNSVVESNKKLCNRSKILETLVENSSEVVVSFSYLKSRHLQEMKQFVEKTGGTVTDEITQCSVLVTDKIRCTMKILSAIARGCPIVNANWLKHSYTVKMFQDVDDFIIVDKDAERKYKFQLKESLAKAKAKRLLDGYNVLVTPSVKPGPQEMKVIITCAGGNYVLNWTTTQYSKELIVTCDKDRARWKSAWDNDSAKIIDSDILVTSIIRQKLIM